MERHQTRTDSTSSPSASVQLSFSRKPSRGRPAIHRHTGTQSHWLSIEQVHITLLNYMHITLFSRRHLHFIFLHFYCSYRCTTCPLQTISSIHILVFQQNSNKYNSKSISEIVVNKSNEYMIFMKNNLTFIKAFIKQKGRSLKIGPFPSLLENQFNSCTIKFHFQELLPHFG